VSAEPLIPVAEVAEAWRVSKNYVYSLIASGALPATTLPTGRAKTRIPESALAEFVARNTRRTKGSAA